MIDRIFRCILFSEKELKSNGGVALDEALFILADMVADERRHPLAGRFFNGLKWQFLFRNIDDHQTKLTVVLSEVFIQYMFIKPKGFPDASFQQVSLNGFRERSFWYGDGKLKTAIIFRRVDHRPRYAQGITFD